MSVDIFDYDDLLELAERVITYGTEMRGSTRMFPILGFDGSVVTRGDGWDKFRVYPAGGKPNEYRTVSSIRLSNLWGKRIEAGVPLKSVPLAEAGAFGASDAEMIRRSVDLARALDITPTAAQRLIEMRTEYKPPRELE